MSGGPIIVTRPVGDAGSLMTALDELGCQPIAAPLMTIECQSDVKLPALAFQAVLVTSANSCRALAGLSGGAALRDVMTIAVGETSAEVARQGGQTNVVTASGDVDGLIALAMKCCRPDDGPLLYVSGVQTTGELEQKLSAAGFEVHRIVAYEAVAAEILPESVRPILSGQNAAGVVLYSPRTAHIWCKLLAGTKTADRGANLTHYCLSENVACVIRDAFGSRGSIVTAFEPNERAMIAAIKNNIQN